MHKKTSAVGLLAVNNQMQNWNFVVFRLIAVWAAFFAVCGESMAFPDLPNAIRPNPEPTIPSGWDVFIPPIGPAAVDSGGPSIAEWTRTARPDDTLILTGDKLSNFVGADEGKDTEFLIFGQTATNDAFQSSALIRRLEGAKAAITLPMGLPAWSTYFVWPKNFAGYGNPVAINRTETWWISSDQVSRGDVISVYGRNLSHNHGIAASWIYLKSAGGAGAWVTPTSVNPYRVQFLLPASTTNGTYEIWIHNGHGGSYGWCGPLSFSVIDKYSWNGPVYNVKDFGATGDGDTDDTNSIQSAYRAALSDQERTGHHPTLYFPSGTYMMRSGISFAHDCRYLGDGKDLSCLKCNRYFNQPGDGNKAALLFSPGGSVHDVEVKDLTLDANGNFGPPTNTNNVLLCAWGTPSPDIRLTNVRVKMLIPDAGLGCAFINSAKRLSITGCEFIGGYLFLEHGNKCIVSETSFIGANDSPTSIFQWATSDLSITNCRVADYDIKSPTGQGQGRFLTGNGAYDSQRNVYIGDNTTVDCGPRADFQNGDGNTGEHIMCEGNWTQYVGKPISAKSTTVTFADLTSDYTGQSAIISNGKGTGQQRLITGYDAGSRTISVTPGWAVAPDTSSLILIAHSATRWVVYHNTFDGKNDYATRRTATTAIGLAGGCYDWIGDGNIITNMYYGLYNTGDNTQAGSLVSINPCYFNIFENNIIKSCYNGILYGAGIPSISSTIGVDLLGTVYRNNTVTDITASGAVQRVWCGALTPPAAAVDFSVIEHNTFTNLPQGVDLDFSDSGSSDAGPLIKNSILYKNAFNLGAATLLGSFGAKIGNNSNPTFIDNTWTGFEKSYTGSKPGPVLELAFRTIDIATSSVSAQGTMMIRNTGTSTLSWNAASDSSWLQLAASTGTIANEGTSSAVTLTCNPIGFLPGSYVGAITVTGASQIKKITVTMLIGANAPTKASLSVLVR